MIAWVRRWYWWWLASEDVYVSAQWLHAWRQRDRER
jgi:hypothetical protein